MILRPYAGLGLHVPRHRGTVAYYQQFNSGGINKRTKYAALDHGYEFTAVAVETMGTWGPEAMAISSALGARLQQVSGDKRSTAFLRQRMSLAVQRGNAAAIRGTLAPSDPIDS